MGSLSNGLTLALGSINNQVYPSQIKKLYESQCLKVPRHIVTPKMIDLRAELDVLAKIYFIKHSSLARSYLVQPYDLNKPEYHCKEFQEVKAV